MYCGVKGCSGRISGHHSQRKMGWKSPNSADSQRLPQRNAGGEIKSSGKQPYSHLRELVNFHGKGELSSSSIKVTPLWPDQCLHGSRCALQCPLAELADKSPTWCHVFPTTEPNRQDPLEYFACCCWRWGPRGSDLKPPLFTPESERFLGCYI